TFVANGHEVIGMAGCAESRVVAEIESLGCRFVPFPIDKTGFNPFSDFKVLLSLYKTFKLEKPDLILTYTIKPVIWGGVAARLYGDARFYGLITGLGFAFQRGGFKRNLLGKIAKTLYKHALAKACGVIFQNPDNQQTFIDQKIVSAKRTHRVYGSGVNVLSYIKTPLPEGGPVFLTIARLLGEKGLREFAQAAKLVKEKYPKARFQILGPEVSSPDGIKIEEVESWQKEGWIEYLGSTRDVRPYINKCNIFTLASYHEGMPRSVLEAMSIGRPILTTNVEGCRETVLEGMNGFLVAKKDAAALAERMIWFIENPDGWQTMGVESRTLAEKLFDVHKVNTSLLEILKLKSGHNA
ncbi:MAG: glycosyltransferase involved in cell wall biosynthesis, partial [Sediminicola sp.]